MKITAIRILVVHARMRNCAHAVSNQAARQGQAAAAVRLRAALTRIPTRTGIFRSY